MQPTESLCPKLLITGRRRNKHYRVDVAGQVVWLPRACFEALLDLIVAAVESESGLVSIPRMTIHRLRKAIEPVLGAAATAQLIANGDGEEYSLAIPKARIRACFRIAPCFYELVTARTVSAEQAEILRKHCGKRIIPKNEA